MQPFHILISSRQFNGDSTIRGAVIDGEPEHLRSPGVCGTAPSESYIRKYENSLVRLSVEGGARYYGDYSHCDPNATIVTDRFLTVLTALQPDGWAAVPVAVEIINRPKLNPTPDRFFIFTVVGLVDGLDEERTHYVRRITEPLDWKLPVHRYALKPGACEGRHLFRLQQDDHILIASEAFRQACLSQKLRGIDFRNLEQVDSS